jgi:flagellin
MSSILTNTSAMVALQTMKAINKGMAKVQDEISTGMKVATAKDNSSSWAIAARMRSDVTAFEKISDSLTVGNAAVGVARAAAEQIVDTLQMIQEKVVQAREPGADIAKLQADTDALLATIGSTAASAQFNGINLVSATPATATIVVSMIRTDATTVATAGAGTLTVAGVNLQGLGDALALTAGDDTALTALQGRLTTAMNAAASFGAAQIRIESQQTFLNKQADALKIGVGAYVDADMEEASARLQALQVQQQLGIQALSIANQSPSNILALFR